MLCPKCGFYAEEDAIVCSRCGKLLEREYPEDEEMMNFRQGRHLRRAEQAQEEVPAGPRSASGASRSFEETRVPQTPESTGAVYGDADHLSSTGRFYGSESDFPAEMPINAGPVIMQERVRHRRSKRITPERVINWAYVLIACVMLVLALVIGTWLYLDKTPGGQVLMARMGQDASSAAMWQVGEELLTRGEVEKAISYFLTAREKDEEAETPNPVGLNLLGSAYEAQGTLEMAHEVYAYIYTEVVPSEPEAYRNQVRVLLELGRQAEAAQLLQLAYQQTGLATFRSQRLEILPSVPTASVIAGYYTEKKSVELEQSEDYAIYYTTDEFAELPAAGTLYTKGQPIELGEGEHQIRAVAVNGDLVSDEVKFKYQIYMPTPLAPDVNLAPNTYYKLRTVRIRPGKLSDEELEQNPGYAATLDDPVATSLTFYYTIDGSAPDLDSPIFDPNDDVVIQLPSGRVTLKAVAVNGYGKASQTLVRTYKFDVRPYPQDVYSTKDLIGDLKIGGTTRESWLGKYGQYERMEMTTIADVDGECERYVYPWGYATFMKGKTGWVLADLYFTTGEFEGPRGTRIGMTETEVTKKFKDFGQITSPSGNRGLYAVEGGNDKGKIYVQEDGGKIIRYRTGTADGHVWQLDYNLDANGVVISIRWLYER